FTHLAPSLCVDAKTIGELPWVVSHPLHVKCTDAGLLIHAVPVNGVASIIRLPLAYRGDSFRMHVKFRVERLPFASGLHLGFHCGTGDGGRGHASIELSCRGGGDVNSWERNFAVGAGVLELDDVDPAEPIEVEITFNAEDRRAISRAKIGKKRFFRELWLDRF